VEYVPIQSHQSCDTSARTAYLNLDVRYAFSTLGRTGLKYQQLLWGANFGGVGSTPELFVGSNPG
jgi:hypothetical protein